MLMLLAALAALAAACPPAAAQFWGSNPYSSYPRGGSRDYFSFPFYGGQRPPPVADYSKAPPPRKLEAPPTSSIVVIGDSMADWLAYGLDESYTDQPDVGVVRQVRATAGLIHYDSRNETLDWPQVVKDALAAEKPSAVIIMLGLNDRVSIRDGAPAARPASPPNGAAKPGEQSAKPATPEQAPPPAADAEGGAPGVPGTEAAPPVPGRNYEFHTDQWATLYAKRIDEMIAAAKSKGVPVLWVGLPALRGPKSTGDMAYLDELYRERAERGGVAYVDIWDGFVDDQGRYAVQGPDFEGQIRRLRTADGVHFTKAGAIKLASYVDQELRRMMSTHAVPVALPTETAPPKPTGTARPDVGPVLPLTASSAADDQNGDLLGAGGHAPPLASDPLAAKVLSRGDAVPVQAGRADDFSWPRPAADNGGTAPPEPASLTGPPAKKAAAGDSKKGTDAKAGEKANDKKKPDAAGAPKFRSGPRAELDGAPRPPKPVGGGF